MSRIFINGIGAVSPAGWGVPAMRDAVAANAPLAVRDLARPGWAKPLRIRAVPNSPTRLEFASHGRLRRVSVMSQHIVAAALEAIGSNKPARLGIVVAMLSGLIPYTRRFFEEVLRDPSKASPLIFPETVFNAPGSHLAAYFGTTAPSATLVGDDGMFVQGLALAAEWLAQDQVDGCIVIGSEELDWLVADAFRLFARDAIYASGAGAVYLTKNGAGALAELDAVTDGFTMAGGQCRAKAARAARNQLPALAQDELLCDGICNRRRFDEAETAAWQDWNGARIHPKTVLGEAFTASAAWQCVTACDALARGAFPAATVSVVGVSQQAIGARFLSVVDGA